MQLTGPLEGVQVLAVEQYGAGPFSTMLLADMGATVIKIEDPAGGDVGREVPPYLAHEDSIYFQSLNRNKRSITLDLRDPVDQERFRQLVSQSSAVFNNLRGDQPKVRGLDYSTLSEVKRSIVCVHLSGFGNSGSRSRHPGYDYLMQGLAGWMSITGDPEGPPQKSGLSLVDLSAGIAAALGLVSALRDAEARGIGRDVHVSLYDTALSLLTYVGAWHLTKGYIPERQPDSSHPSQVPSQLLPTADGWIVVMCAKEKFFRRLTRIIGKPDLATDPRFSDFSARLDNRDALVQILKEVFRTRPTDEWIEMIGDEVPCAPVLTVPEALDAEEAARMIITVDHEEFGTVRQLASPIHFGGWTMKHMRAPRLGEDTDEIMSAAAAPEDDAISSRSESGGSRSEP